MKSKSLKESIQKSIKENILNEKWSDAIPQAISGIANAGRNIAGQYALGGIDKRFQRVGDRIEKDWKDSADEIAAKANKLAGSKNQMIAKQAQMTLDKVDNIDRQISQAMRIMKNPADASLKQADPLEKHPEEKAFEEWLRNSGGRPENLSKTEYGKYFQKWRQLRALGLDPRNIPIEDMEREVAIAAHKRHLSLKDLDSQLKKTNKYGAGLGAEFIGSGDEDENDEGEDISHEIPAPRASKMAPPPPKPAIPPPPPPKAPQNAQKRDVAGEIMAKQRGNLPQQTQKPSLPTAGGSREPSYADAGIPSLDKRNATQGNVGSPRPLPGSTSAPEMKSPENVKGKAAPPPVRPPSNTQFLPQNQPKTQEEPEQPIPLTKLRPYQGQEPIPLTKQKKHVMEMPPREEKPIPRAVPASIKDMMPPIRDDGDEIQVGSEEKPAISPRNDVIQPKKTKKKPSAKK